MGKFIMNSIKKWKENKLKDRIKKVNFYSYSNPMFVPESTIPFTIYFTDVDKEIERRKSGPSKRMPHSHSLPPEFHTPIETEDELIEKIKDGTLFYGGCMIQSFDDRDDRNDFEMVVNKYFSKKFGYRIESFLMFIGQYSGNNNIEIGKAQKKMTYYIHFTITKNIWRDFVDFFFKYK